jgi:multidrug efflux pump subunit AcrA (membrane-fusion protein)
MTAPAFIPKPPSLTTPSPGEAKAIFLHPATPDEFLPPISRWTILGGLVLLAAFSGAIALASVLKYKVSVKAPAAIRPDGELRIVQSSVEGTVKSIKVAANQVVKQGDIIALIDDSRLQTKKRQLQGNIQQATLQLAQIEIQASALDSQIAAEADRTQRAIASFQAEVSRTQRDLKDKQITAVAQANEAEANLRIAQEEWQKAQAELTAAKADLKSIQAALKAVTTKQDRYKPLAEAGAISLDKYQEAQLAVEQQEQAQESQKAAILAKQQDIERQKRAVEAAASRWQGTQAALNPSDATVTMVKEKIAAESATGKATLARLKQEREQLIQRKVEFQNQINRDRQELQQLETELANTVIRAVASGTILQLNLRNTDQVVRPGDAIAQIAPSEAPLVIKAMVSSRDIGKVETSQTAYLRVSACPYPDYGILKGKVSTISPDAIKPQGKDTNTAQASIAVAVDAAYDVTIQPEALTLSIGGRKCTIQSGMEGTTEIISREETVLQFILRRARLLMG